MSHDWCWSLWREVFVLSRFLHIQECGWVLARWCIFFRTKSSYISDSLPLGEASVPLISLPTTTTHIQLPLSFSLCLPESALGLSLCRVEGAFGRWVHSTLVLILQTLPSGSDKNKIIRLQVIGETPAWQEISPTCAFCGEGSQVRG